MYFIDNKCLKIKFIYIKCILGHLCLGNLILGFFSRNIPNRSHKHFDTIMIKVILLGKPKGRLAHYHLSLYEIIIPKFCWHNGIKIF